MRYRNIRFFVFLFGISLILLIFQGCATTASTAQRKPEEDDVWSLLKRGETEKAREFFLGEVTVHDRNPEGLTPLHVAAEIQSPEMAAFFISLGAEVDAEDNQGRTPLGISAEKMDGATGRVLTGAGADIHHSFNNTTTIAKHGIEVRGEFLEALLVPASLESADKEGRTILHLAAAAGNVQSTEMILRAGASVQNKDAAGNTALDLAFSRTDTENYPQTAEKIILAGGQSAHPLYSYFAPAVRSSNYDIRFFDGTAPLHHAAGEGHTGYVEYLLNKKAMVNIKSASGATPLHEAARSGNIGIMKMLLARGAEVNAQDAKGNSVMHIAIPRESHREGLELLLSYGANPNLRDEHGDSPLHIVIALNRDPEMARLLLAGGADVSIPNIDGKTPLHQAVQENRLNFLPLLLEYGADIFATDNTGISPFEMALLVHNAALPYLITGETVLRSDSSGNTALHIAVKNNADPEIITLILKHGARIDARNKEGDTSLHLTVRLDNQPTGELLLAAGSDIFVLNARGESPLYLTFHSAGDVREWMLTPTTLAARDGLGNTVLHYAAQWRLDNDIPLIVQKGASTEAINTTGETPLFVAVKINSPSTVQALITAGTPVDGRDALGNSSLHAAVRWNAPEAARVLITSGANTNAQDMNGRTPLHEAVRLGILDMENVLFRYGADPEIRDNNGKTPFMEAVSLGNADVVERLASRGVDIMVRNNLGDTPLHIAVAQERSDLTGLLLHRGASIHAKNTRGESPFQIALATSPRMVSTLLTPEWIVRSDDEGHSPLHIAIRSEAPAYLIGIILNEEGVRIAAVDADGHTPLRLAVDRDNWEVAKMLADAGSDPFSVSEDGKNPGGIAITKGPEPVRALFTGRGIQARDASGNTALHYAARDGNAEVVRLLISLGADKSSRNITAESPADIARRWNRNDIALLL
ncbi:MAG: ankyrin repeat domain-containing protein [Spirochaetaceae bacterium]|nr:ankyrin repeat domain-containing protein [Spirochaetaceae bacterium]